MPNNPGRLFFIAVFALLVLPVSGQAQIAVFKTLDKVTAKIDRLETPVGVPTVLGPLTVTVRTCKTTPPEEPPETTVYVEIDESREGRTEQLFSGWMFASSPGLNGLEHPVYDLWPEACKTVSGEAFTGNE